MRENTGSSKKRKALSATLAVAMAATMVLSGTLAYFYQSFAVNTFKEEATVKNVIAHDDFDPATGNKDVYVENAGTSPVYVRIKLTEDYQEKNADGNYVYKEHFGVNAKYTELGLQGGEMNHGLPAKRDSAIITAHNAFHENYFSWKWGTKGKTYLKAGNNEETNSYGSDATQDQYFDATNKIAYDRTNAGGIYMDTGNSSIYGTTQDSDGVITDTQWKALDSGAAAGTAEEKLEAAKKKAEFTGWVLDTDRGYYHWSQPLLPGQATGLLLDQVDKEGLVKSKDASYQYNIHVQFEAVDEVDFGLWTDAAQATPYDVNSDAWLPDISEKAGWLGIRSLLDMQRFKTSVNQNVDAIVTEIQALIDEYKALKYENASDLDHNGESLTSAEAISLLEDAKLGIYYSSFAKKVGKSAVEEMNKAVSVQSTYKEDKIKYFESGKEEDNPDKVVFETVTEGANKDVINDLIARYGADGKITKSQAENVTVLHIGGSSESRKMKVDNLDLVFDNTFPNVEALEIQYANLNSSITSLSNLPQKLKSLYVGYNTSALTTINVSNLQLDLIQILNVDGYKQLNADGLVGLNDSKGTLTFADLRGFKFDSGVNLDDFSKLETLYLCSVSSVSLNNCTSLEMIDLNYDLAKSSLTELDLEDCRNLKTANLKKCDAINKLTISENAVITDVAHFPLYVKKVTYGTGGTNTYTYKKYTDATTIEDSNDTDFNGA